MARQRGTARQPAVPPTAPVGLTDEEVAAQATDLPERLSLSLVAPPVGPGPGAGAAAAPAAGPAAAAEAGKAPAESGAEAALAADAAQTGAAAA